jgi:hypothetical protein
MRWVLRLIATGDDARCLSTDLAEICRPEGLDDIASLGLTLPEASSFWRAFSERSFPRKPTAMGCGGRAARPATENAT